MAEQLATGEEQETAARKGTRLPLILGVLLALVLGGAGFYGVRSGMILGGDQVLAGAAAAKAAPDPLPDVAFVPIEPLTISLGKTSSSRHLRFSAQLEVYSDHRQEVAALLPRVIDVLNGYLRAVETADLENPAALIRLRAQMLRRVQIVTGEDRVRDLLIMEFVLS